MPARRRCPRSALLLAVAAVSLATGCSSPSAARTRSAPSPAGAVTEEPVPPTTAPPVPSASPSPTDAAPDLVLEGDGLGLLQGDTPHPLPFAATTAAAVQQAVEDALGPVAATPLADCREGARTGLTVDGFTVLLDGERFVGWTDGGAADRSLTTADGIGVGSKLGDLQSALPDVVLAPGPTGAAWSSPGGLSGQLSGGDAAAVVTAISGGQPCTR